ncbi:MULTISPECIES: hypothetical protein [unclassified Marinovum]
MPLSRFSPSFGDGSAEKTGIFDAHSGSIPYIAADSDTRQAARVDAVMPVDPASASASTDTDTSPAENSLRWADRENPTVPYIPDAHAKHLTASKRGVVCDAYARQREARNVTISPPDRMLHAPQLNLRARRSPKAERDGTPHLKIPINRF